MSHFLNALQRLDTKVFILFNERIHNPVFDVVMPILTNLAHHWYFWVAVVIIWVSMIIFGGKRGRAFSTLIPFVMAVSDQTSSHLIKHLVNRPRPCWLINGHPLVPHERLLQGRLGSPSFPSSHSTNMMALATLLIILYPKKWWLWLLIPLIIGYTRVYVGVHFPGDVLGGYAVGFGSTCFVVWVSTLLGLKWSDPKTEKAAERKENLPADTETA